MSELPDYRHAVHLAGVCARSRSRVRILDARQCFQQDDAVALSQPAAAPVRVLIADDQPAFREVARELIEATAGFEWIGGASSGEEAIEQALHLRPDLLLMDVRMPGIGGIEAARQLASHGLPSIVVLITADEPPSDPVAGTVAEVVSKQRLNAALLRRLWEGHAYTAINES